MVRAESGVLLSQMSMDVLWPFIHQRREVNGVQNATVNRPLEIARRIQHLTRNDWLGFHSASPTPVISSQSSSSSIR
jgi:hypothetical protein